jgi:REP element-mobilizing transposase RayT
VEVTVRAVQGRFLLKPSPGFREIVIGALARAQSLYPVQVHALACLSNHLHLLLSPESVYALASFMRHFNTNLSKEAARLHDWSGPLLQRRYQGISVSDEEEMQLARLRYILEQGCKENLVAKPADWPGAHCARALVEGEPLAGIWFNRTAEYNARRKRVSFRPEDFAVRYQLELAPLPCWTELSPSTIQSYVAEMVGDIEAETRERHRREGTRPLGIRSVLKQHPHSKPKASKKSPAPLFHALARRVRQELRQAYAAFVASFREAAERLRQGDLTVCFPAGCFPPPGPPPRPDPFPV